MTSRERVLAALNHRQPDKVAVDFGGHRSSGIAAMAYPKLRKALGLPERPIRVYDRVQQLAIIDDDVLERFQVDAIELGRGFALEDKHWADWTLPDGTPCQMPAWALPERQERHWVLRSGQRPGSGQNARRRHLFRAVLLAVFGKGRSRQTARGARRRTCGVALLRRPALWPPAPRANASWPRGPRDFAKGPIGPSSGFSAATSWKSASGSTAWTIS